MAMALEHHAALAGRARRIEAGYGLVVRSKHAMFAIDREPAFRMHEHRLYWSEADVGAGAERCRSLCQRAR